MRVALAVMVCVTCALIILAPRTFRVQLLPGGVVVLHSELVVPAGTELRGAGSTILRAAPDFRGRALVVCAGPGIRLSDFQVDGNRAALEQPMGLPPYDRPFVEFTPNNGILADRADGLAVARVGFHEVAGFAILVARTKGVTIDNVTIRNSGGRNEKGRNNTTGGILLEEGTSDFRVTRCAITNVRGNGVWTHSLYTSPRNGPGTISGNCFRRIGRDALQAGHAIGIEITGNTGTEIGFPIEDVDMEAHAIPVGVDTAGNVEGSAYARNRFEEVNGKCFDLDGFHHGEVRENVCINSWLPERYPYGNYGIVMNNTNPDMQSTGIRITGNLISGMLFGGIFVIGSGNTVADNRLLDLNTAHCNEEAVRFGCYHAAGEPEMLRSGIYLGRGAERPAIARGNTIERNVITGFRMAERCIGLAPGVSPGSNTIRGNRCADRPPPR
jgi:hypothetical protein